MLILFAEGYEKLTKLIFELYDFDKDGKISKEDIRVVLSYIPLLNNKKSKNKINISSSSLSTSKKSDFTDRVESQDEIFNLLEICFEDKKLLNYSDFRNVIENKRSDIFLFVLIFLLEKKPFNNKSFEDIKKVSSNFLSPFIEKKTIIASPALNSKLSPSLTIRRSSFMKRRQSVVNESNPKKDEKQTQRKNFLLEYAKNNIRFHTEILKNSEMEKIYPRKKGKISMKKAETSRERKDYSDLPIIPARKTIRYKTHYPQSRTSQIDNSILITFDSNKTIEFDENYNSNLEEECIYEGWLLKNDQNNNLIRKYYKLLNKDLCYYSDKDDSNLCGVYNLSGVFIKQGNTITFQEKIFYGFSINCPLEIKEFYVENENEYVEWIKHLHKATDYSDLNELYEIKENIGVGRFGIVRLGINRETNEEVAIKILAKNEMSCKDLELVRTEIEILKICQHPNIINLIEVFENMDYFYIIMEYCPGGELFNFLESRNFQIPELFAGQIIHKLLAAVFYLHQYGIAHRDLKLENILIMQKNNSFEIKILDFGLSKIIGPNEKCDEPFGTISYVSPEVLLKIPHNKSVDIWSIGIITYVLLSGYFPFDHESNENEIARQTIYNPTPFPNTLWDKISLEAKSFVDSLLQKNPLKRLTIEEALKHPWIVKISSTKISEMRRKSVEEKTSLFKIFTTTNFDK